MPGDSKCVAIRTAKYYSEYFNQIFETSLITEPIDTDAALTTKINALTATSYKMLLNSFENELQNNMNFYSLYDISYFLEIVPIPECKPFFYNISNAADEIECNTNERLATFYNQSYKIYTSYVESICNFL